MAKPDRAARVAGRVTEWWVKRGCVEPATNLKTRIERAVRRECKRAVEECAQIAEGFQIEPTDGQPLALEHEDWNEEMRQVAAAIRGRK